MRWVAAKDAHVTDSNTSDAPGTFHEQLRFLIERLEREEIDIDTYRASVDEIKAAHVIQIKERRGAE